MQFSCKSPLHCSRCYASSKQLQLLCLAMSMLLCILVSPAGSSDCPSTCTPNECPRLRPRNCVHRYRDACNCCEYCGMGPGELCEGLWNQYGFCATGLECVKTIEEGLPREQQEQLPGTCREISTIAPTTAPTTLTTDDETFTDSSSTTRDIPTHTVATTQLPTSQSTQPPTPPVQCRRECSVTYCDGKNRVCSAKGLEFAPSSTRNSCQHTSCHACVLLVRPAGCGEIQCGEPPTKACLRKYFECIHAHYFEEGVPSSNRVLRLHDPEAANLYAQGRGRILCHIVDLLST